MPLALATLEGTNDMTTKLLSRKPPKIMRRPGNTHLVSSSFALYGTDSEYVGIQELGGWLTDLKKTVKGAASSVADAGSAIVRPVASIAAETLRTVAVPAGQAVGAVIGTAAGTGGTPAAAGQGAGASFLDSLSSLFGGKKSTSPTLDSSGNVVYLPTTNATPTWIAPTAIGGGVLLLVLLLKKK